MVNAPACVTTEINPEEEVPKWQYQRERFLKPDVIKDAALFGSSLSPLFADVQTAASLPLRIRYVRLADIIRA